jgi:enoyl-CoA hydratase
MTDWILEAREGDIVTLTFNDPQRLNAMTRSMGEAFRDRALHHADDPSLRALIITGKGRAFSAGGDLEMIGERAREGRTPAGREQVRDTMRSFYDLFLSILRIPCPTLAAINGHAIGAGLCVALACDLRIAAAEAKLGLNFTKIGLHPGMGASWTLPRLVGPARAAEILYTSRLFGAEEAERIGLVNRCLPRDEVLPESLGMAHEIAGCAPIANRALKRGLERSPGASLAEQLDFEASEQALCFESDDILEGIAAAREKRSPDFSGS